MPPEPPRRKPSSPVIEEMAPGAIHELRKVQPMSERPTVPPPAIPHDPKPAPFARHAPRSPTVIGMPAPPSLPAMRERQDSTEISNQTLLDELAARGDEARAEAAARRAAQAEADELRRQLRELDRSNHLPHVEVAPRSSLPPNLESMQ